MNPCDPNILTKYHVTKIVIEQVLSIHEKWEDVLNVSQLDETVESLLKKKYGHKAAYGSSPLFE